MSNISLLPGYFQIGQYYFRRKEYEKARKYLNLAAENHLPGAFLMVKVIDLFDQYTPRKGKSCCQYADGCKRKTLPITLASHFVVLRIKCATSPSLKCYMKPTATKPILNFLNILATIEARVLKLESGVEKLPKIVRNLS